ncbi:MAG: CoB--CoM heterodisulfide reductase iron-sulfur subunit B family protein [Thermodesulfobacteriota bacterium]|nr:CoB--CoM heterodisulfide reductase iron-sulfur subunit B family protein [Thermodesulfobacteriota bacterium]
MNKYAFFIGCTILQALPHLEAVARKVLPQLDIELIDLPFSCCPNSDFRSADELSWLALAARNLALAEREGLDILCLCPGCSQTLKEANMALIEDESLKTIINKRLGKIGLKFGGTTQVNHHLVILYRKIELLRDRINTPLSWMKLAAHPSCHMLMPSSSMEFDNPEQPGKLDELVKILGGVPVDYPEKTLCCGFGLFGSYRKTSSMMIKDKVESAASADAEAFVVTCPSCFQQLDRNQVIAKRELKFDVQLPVLYYLQLIGLAIGLKLNEVGYSFARIKSSRLEDKIKYIASA